MLMFRMSWRISNAIVAGLAERFMESPDLSDYPTSLLQAALAFDLTHPILTTNEGTTERIAFAWKTAILEQQPVLARDAYKAVARAQLAKSDQTADGLRELLTLDAFWDDREELAIEFLRDFPNANPFRLDEMLDAAMSAPAAHPEFLALAGPVLDGAVQVDERQRDMWLAAAYLLAPTAHAATFEAAARERPGLIFEVRDRSGYERRYPGQAPIGLSLPQLESIARLTGTLWPATSPPSNGWGGDTNAWDAWEYFYALTNRISANPSESATAALSRLEGDTALASYRPHVLHALAQQRTRRRETEYDRPDWPHIVKALANGAPATVADLHALLVAHLDELKTRIARANTDPLKAFWNLDSYARPETPRPEEACRDTLVDMLRNNVAALGISVEPEGHMARDKRADISVAMPGRKILCELKRDYHAEVWTAADTQLERFYAHDQEAQGFGVYIVLWFGDKRPVPIPAPPGGAGRPATAAEMEQMLRARIPSERASRIAVIVIDVSGG